MCRGSGEGGAARTHLVFFTIGGFKFANPECFDPNVVYKARIPSMECKIAINSRLMTRIFSKTENVFESCEILRAIADFT